MRIFVWLIRAFIFFTLFAFALNNLQPVTIHWFLGAHGSAPLVIVVLIAFGAGCALGVLAMVPAWWKHRRQARRVLPLPPELPTKTAPPPGAMSPSDFGPEHPPREGL
jgi:uncharacterized integral membrane protein